MIECVFGRARNIPDENSSFRDLGKTTSYSCPKEEHVSNSRESFLTKLRYQDPQLGPTGSRMLQWVAGVSARVLVYIHSEFLRLLYFLADRQASDDFTALGPRICLTRRSIATAAASTSASIAAPSAWRALRLLRSVLPPTSRAAMLLCLVPCNYVLH